MSLSVNLSSPTIDPRTIDREAIFAKWAKQAVAYQDRVYASARDAWYRRLSRD